MIEILEPVVIEPAGMNPENEWEKCRAEVDRLGGVVDSHGDVNWRAAFSADPGITTCPVCHVQHWAWGRVVQCARCAFQFPTDWWPMYSYGVNAATAVSRWAKIHQGNNANLQELHEKRLAHAYYKYGFDNPVADAWAEHERIDWKTVMEAR